MKTLQEQVLTADYESCWGYLPGECWGRDASIKLVGGFAKSIPDMKFDVKEVLVAGDRVIVRGEVTGTPAGDLFVCPIAARASGSYFTRTYADRSLGLKILVSAVQSRPSPPFM
jgi:hypothetical protein